VQQDAGLGVCFCGEGILLRYRGREEIGRQDDKLITNGKCRQKTIEKENTTNSKKVADPPERQLLALSAGKDRPGTENATE
jgi:hypothetical protein